MILGSYVALEDHLPSVGKAQFTGHINCTCDPCVLQLKPLAVTMTSYRNDPICSSMGLPCRQYKLWPFILHLSYLTQYTKKTCYSHVKSHWSQNDGVEGYQRRVSLYLRWTKHVRQFKSDCHEEFEGNEPLLCELLCCVSCKVLLIANWCQKR